MLCWRSPFPVNWFLSHRKTLSNSLFMSMIANVYKMTYNTLVQFSPQRQWRGFKSHSADKKSAMSHGIREAMWVRVCSFPMFVWYHCMMTYISIQDVITYSRDEEWSQFLISRWYMLIIITYYNTLLCITLHEHKYPGCDKTLVHVWVVTVVL